MWLNSFCLLRGLQACSLFQQFPPFGHFLSELLLLNVTSGSIQVVARTEGCIVTITKGCSPDCQNVKRKYIQEVTSRATLHFLILLDDISNPCNIINILLE